MELNQGFFKCKAATAKHSTNELLLLGIRVDAVFIGLMNDHVRQIALTAFSKSKIKRLASKAEASRTKLHHEIHERKYRH
jgi:hypothetical protein